MLTYYINLIEKGLTEMDILTLCTAETTTNDWLLEAVRTSKLFDYLKCKFTFYLNVQAAHSLG